MRLFLALVLTIVTFLSSSRGVLAASYEQCTLGQDCTIGEFLYNDDYTILTGATCTITSEDPSGTSTTYTAATGATTEDNGWYYKTFTSSVSDAEGVYPTTMCCNDGTNDLCIDKSFELKSAAGLSLTAANIADAVLDEPVDEHTTSGSLGGNLQNASFSVSDIWNNPTRTLTSFGSLAGDVWSYSTRSLSTFGSLITDIWGSSSNTTSNTSTTTITEITNIKNELDEQRALLEAVVNEPIIKSYIEEGDTPDVQEKIGQTRDAANKLYSQVQTAKTRLAVLERSWASIDKSTALSELKLLSSLINDSTSEEDTSITALTSWLEDAWGNPVTTDAASYSLAASQNLSSAIEDTSYYGTSAIALTSVKSTLDNLELLSDVVGNIGNSAEEPTIFGHLKKVQRRAEVLDNADRSLDNLISNQDSFTDSELSSKVAQEQTSILALNEFPYSLQVLSSVKASVKNKLYALRALLDINKSLLASNTKSSPTVTWLEDGSVVFRTVITNPSTIATQTARLKYMLPKELDREDIIDLSPELTVDYDPDNETLFVAADFKLEPEEAVVVYVETEDIWFIPQEELDKYRQESDALVQDMDGTPNTSQPIELKTDIDRILGEIETSQDQGGSPSTRIKTYRENVLKLLDVTADMQELSIIYNQVATNNSITGFIGGSQAIVAWGLIALFLAGFAFLTIYMRSLVPSYRGKKGSEIGGLTKATTTTINLRSPIATYLRKYALPLTILLLALITIIGATIYNKSRRPALQAPVTVPSSPSSPSPSPSDADQEEKKLILGKSTTLSKYLDIPQGSSVNLRSGPGVDFPIVVTLQSPTEVFIFGQEQDLGGESWSQIGLSDSDSNRDWWVLTSLLE